MQCNQFGLFSSQIIALVLFASSSYSTTIATTIAIPTVSSSISSCTFPLNLNDTEVMNLYSAPNATDIITCAEACCSIDSCQVYQWCLPGFNCGPANSCWIGSLSGGTQPSSGWVSAARPRSPPTGPLTINLTTVPSISSIPNMPPVTSPLGHILSIDSGGFRLDNIPFLDISGEMHFSRVPTSGWAKTLRRLRAAGLTTVASYVLWIHHEEVQGEFNFTGQRDLRAFVQEAAKAGLYVSLRIGPYGHAECRGGGLPDWISQIPGISLRTEQPLFMSFAQKWYNAIASQLVGLFFVDGGPILSIQLDNETGDAPYLLALKAAAITANIKAPFFVATGNNTVPFGSMLPFAGRYAVAFWDCSSDPSDDYLFTPPDFLTSPPSYPTLYCELGSGMASVYGCRHAISPSDMAAAALVTLAAAQGLGYYMFVGGLNPQGKLSTLQERSKYYAGVFELPIVNYDFVAPFSQSGTPRGQLHLMRMMHSLASDPAIGPWLPSSSSFLPNFLPSSGSDTTSLRWQVRFDGISNSCLLFVNNYVRDLVMTNQTGIRFQLTLPLPNVRTILVPAISSPAVNISSGLFFIWPVFLPIPIQASPLQITYALAQPLGTVQTPTGTVFLFAATLGIPTEFCFENASLITVLYCSGVCLVEGTHLFARTLRPGRGTSLTLSVKISQTTTNVINFIILDKESGSENVWFGTLAGQRRAFISDQLTSTNMFEFDTETLNSTFLRIITDQENSVSVSILPAPIELKQVENEEIILGKPDGIFTQYTLSLSPPPVNLSIQQVSQAEFPPLATNIAPGDDGDLSGWNTSGVWTITFSPPGYMSPNNETEFILLIDFVGDAARLLTSSSNNASYKDLVNDVFFNNPPATNDGNMLWETPLTRLLGASIPFELTLRILPLRVDSQTIIGLDTWPKTGTGPSNSNGTITSSLELRSIEIKRRETVLLSAS
jgi:beta-galactosidase